ncbi:probable ATP-dependent RNA helicase DDX59 [Acropora millepora]|uniref:probable ATP-dependent RNA helicase DDX59 n=1 Tax=Acropora millepora TaxID=45264 RepID=UPI001CF449CF|nr:probable ATP-dependent RNA helicase DDX59 [Acropora millepora]
MLIKMEAMFIPRSLKRKETAKSDCSRTFIRKRNLQTEKFQLIDERSKDSVQETEPRNTEISTSTRRPLDEPNFSEEGNDHEEEEEEIVSYSKKQRWPTPGEPVCVVCGRYGAYIVDQTDKDVCSLECKARHLKDVTAKKAKELLNERSSSCNQSLQGIFITETTTDSLDSMNSSTQMSMLLLDDGKSKLYYKEHPFITGLSLNQVDDIRINLNIRVKGEKVSKPILEFQHCQFTETLNENLAQFGYLTPTPVQMQVIPSALSLRDVMACAQTGSGKTAAFLLPMIQIIYSEIDWELQNKESINTESPRGLIMAPTRELCMQIEKQAKELMKGLPHMKTALLVGGLPLPPQLHRLRSGVQIVVATPGRLQEIVAQSGVDLSFIKCFVLDEVDVMLQMGFDCQVQDIIDKLPGRKQTLMFSATIPSSIESMATKLLINPVYTLVGSPSAPTDSVKQVVLWVEDKSKKKRLFSILQDSKHFRPPIVVFVDSKMGADLLAEAVCEVCEIHCLPMHGDKLQSERSKTLESFQAGDCPVLVCTSLLGRGIDLPNVSQVINFDMPSSVEEYIHQVGRAGRLGKKGWALTFINNTNKNVFLGLVDSLQPLGVKLPQELLNSPYLQQQRQRTKDTLRKRKHKDTVTHENLMDLIKKNSRRKKAP